MYWDQMIEELIIIRCVQYNNMTAFIKINISLQLVLLISFSMTLASSSRFCFLKKSTSNSNAHFDIEPDDNYYEQGITRQQNSELRSYHPHYIRSLSYPSPITPHIYYGQVKNNRPIFLFKNMDSSSLSSLQALTVNGIQYTDASAKYYLLRRQEQYQYMLVFQMQNSYEYDIEYKIKMIRRYNHFLIIFQYKDTAKPFLLYFTNQEKIMGINQKGLEGVNLYIRNEGKSTTRENWRLSQEMIWTGRNNIPDQKDTNYKGIIIQIQYFDHRYKQKMKINLQQLHLSSTYKSSQFINILQKINIQAILPVIKIDKRNQNCSLAATEKIFQGLSYQYGRLHIKNGGMVVPNQPRELLSFCPSRKRFPWGFLWDDGFHCQVAVREDDQIVLRIIKSWLDTMLDNGWIPRQQNRGIQRQNLCNCPRFLQKDVRDGNPPTLILALDYLRRKGKLNKADFPLQYWNKIKKWYSWFTTTQKDGDIFIFKWHDSINQNGASFTSGMDDFPRPMNVKGHIDLQSWMYFFTKFMIEASQTFNQNNMEYMQNLQLIKINFRFFYDTATGSYRDFDLSSQFSQHFGYPNILPIAFGVLQYHSREYNQTMKLIKEQLDTGQGLSSISMKSPFYLENRDAYWKGPVWININYLFLRGLKLSYPQQKEYYMKLRADLLRVVCGNWQASGFFYQNYTKGKGSFSFPFNGWTSLIAILSNENY